MQCPTISLSSANQLWFWSCWPSPMSSSQSPVWAELQMDGNGNLQIDINLTQLTSVVSGKSPEKAEFVLAVAEGWDNLRLLLIIKKSQCLKCWTYACKHLKIPLKYQNTRNEGMRGWLIITSLHLPNMESPPLPSLPHHWRVHSQPEVTCGSVKYLHNASACAQV